MKKKIVSKILCAILILAILLPGFSSQVMGANTGNYNYLLDSYKTTSGSFTLESSARLYVVAEDEPGEELQRVLKLSASEFASDEIPTASSMEIIWGSEEYSQDGDIVIYTNEKFDSAEAYTMTVSSDRVIIRASAYQGVRYGLISLLKYFRTQGNNVILNCEMSDCPDTAERVVMLDCARKYLSAEWIKNYIREMAWMGYNTLELHFTEEQGIRMDIWDDTYFVSSNGNDYSWICGSKVARWVYDCVDPDEGKYLKTSEVVEILETASEYGIEVIPAFDLPGHSNYLTLKYRQYAYNNRDSFQFTYDGIAYTHNGYKKNGTLYSYDNTSYPNCNSWIINLGRSEYSNWNDSTHWRYNACVDVANPVARAFLLSLVEDYADFFKKYGCDKFNICGDEVVLNNSSTTFAVGWDTYAQKHVNGGKVAYDTFTDFMNETANMLQEKGYTVRAFNDFLCRNGGSVELDSDIEICFWDKTSSAQPVSYYLNQGRTIYNCIAEYTYYVLRLNTPASNFGSYGGMDARDPNNKYFNFHHATADLIWNEWNPSRMYTDTESSPTVSGNQLGGAYFLVWCDYAGMNTVTQIWKGIDSSGTYNIRERMWSNIMKMWNWDVNSSFSYSNFAKLRAKLGDFPGYTDCTTAPTLPTASSVEPALKADHTKLAELLDKTYNEKNYTQESYAIYQEAREYAQLVHNDPSSSQTLVDEAAEKLLEAISNLENKGIGIELQYKAMINDKEECFRTDVYEAKYGENVELLVSNQPGFIYLETKGATLDNSFWGTDSGRIKTIAREDNIIELWYEYHPQYETLVSALTKKLEDYEYKESTLDSYQAAVAEVRKQYDAVCDGEDMCPSELEEALEKLQNAEAGLAIETDDETILYESKLLSEYVSKGKKAVVIVSTTADVEKIDISLEENNIVLHDYCGNIRKNEDGKLVKNWYLSFEINEIGEKTYTISIYGKNTLKSNLEMECR